MMTKSRVSIYSLFKFFFMHSGFENAFYLSHINLKQYKKTPRLQSFDKGSIITVC